MRANLIAGVGAGLLAACAAGQTVEYEDEGLYLAAIADGGYAALVEGFEGSDWDPYRTTNPFDPQAAPSVTSRGLTWSGNDWITTNTNWGRNGTWGIFTIIRGQSTPDTLLVESDGVLYGAGGWINSNPDFGADIGIVIDGVVVAERQIGTGHQFIGVIDPRGFTSVEFVDLEQQSAWGADDFTFATPVACAPDLNGDGSVDSRDFALFLNLFVAGDPGADFDGDGSVDSRDFVAFLNGFVDGC